MLAYIVYIQNKCRYRFVRVKTIIHEKYFKGGLMLTNMNKIFVLLFLTIIIYFIFMDVSLYLRIQYFPRDRNLTRNMTSSYSEETWFECDVSPLCDVTIKALMSDPTNHYIFSPLATITDKILGISRKWTWLTPNMISFSHVLIAFVSAKFVASDSLMYRRFSVLLFLFRTFLDDMDGHVARTRNNIRGERSLVGTTGFYVDIICDVIGTAAYLIGIFFFLTNNLNRKGYLPLQTIPTSQRKEKNSFFKTNAHFIEVLKSVGCFGLQLMISSTAWNRYLELYVNVLEVDQVTAIQYERQNLLFQSTPFLCIAWMWRIVTGHNLVHCLLIAVFCDKIWEFIMMIRYAGFIILFFVIGVSEIYVWHFRKFVFR